MKQWREPNVSKDSFLMLFGANPFTNGPEGSYGMGLFSRSGSVPVGILLLSRRWGVGGGSWDALHMFETISGLASASTTSPTWDFHLPVLSMVIDLVRLRARWGMTAKSNILASPAVQLYPVSSGSRLAASRPSGQLEALSSAGVKVQSPTMKHGSWAFVRKQAPRFASLSKLTALKLIYGVK